MYQNRPDSNGRADLWRERLLRLCDDSLQGTIARDPSRGLPRSGRLAEFAASFSRHCQSQCMLCMLSQAKKQKLS